MARGIVLQEGRPGPMIGGFTTLPMDGEELVAFEQWLHNAGGVRVATTNEWEVVRWKFGGAILILYRNAKGARKWTCNDYPLVNRLEKVMRAEGRAERAEKAEEAPEPAAAPVPRQRTRRRYTATSGPSGAMDVIEPVDHEVPPAPAPVIDGVTRRGTMNRDARMDLKRLLCERQEWRCFYCGTGVALRATEVSALATFEHVVPLSARGPDNAANLVIACERCNQAVGSMSVFEKLTFRDQFLRARIDAENDTSIPF